VETKRAWPRQMHPIIGCTPLLHCCKELLGQAIFVTDMQNKGRSTGFYLSLQELGHSLTGHWDNGQGQYTWHGRDKADLLEHT